MSKRNKQPKNKQDKNHQSKINNLAKKKKKVKQLTNKEILKIKQRDNEKREEEIGK